MIFKMQDCDFGIKYNSVAYNFVHVTELTIDNPQMTKLIRGANAGDKIGISYTEGYAESKKITVTIIGMSASLKTVLDQAFQNKDRLDVYCISRRDGSSKIAKNCMLSQQPMQMAVSESAESMNVALAFETFDIEETHKSE